MRLALIIAAGTVSALPLNAEAQLLQRHTNNVSSFEVDGIRLYMTGDEAMKALKARFPQVRFSISKELSEVHQGKVRLRAIKLADQDTQITVDFQDTLPPSSASEQVSEISVKYLAKPDDGLNYSKAFRAEIIKKYGEPGAPGHDMQDGREPDNWCERLWPNNPVYNPCDSSAPRMTFFQNSLVVTDDGLSKRTQNYLDSKRSAPKPKALPRL